MSTKADDDDGLKTRYQVFICPSCGEQAYFAGFCAICPSHSRLGVYICVPVEKILRKRDELVESQGPAANSVVLFVEDLLKG